MLNLSLMPSLARVRGRIRPGRAAVSEGVDPARRCAGRGQRDEHRFHSRAARHHRPADCGQPLLDTPEARGVKAQGGMVGDREVVGILFRKLLEPEQQNGAMLDGFPRTKVQVECLKMLFDEMIALRREFSGTPEAHAFQAADLSHHGALRRRGRKHRAPD